MARTTKHIPDDADRQTRIHRQQVREQQKTDTNKDERDDE